MSWIHRCLCSLQGRQVDRAIGIDQNVTRSVSRRHPVRVGKVVFRAKGSDCNVQRERLGIPAEVSGNFCLAVTPGIHADSHARGPVVVEGVTGVYAFHLLLLPAQAGIDGEVLARRPIILHKHRMVVGPSFEIQLSEFPTGLAQVYADAAVGTTIRAAGVTKPGDVEFRCKSATDAGTPSASTELKGRVGAIGLECRIDGCLVWIGRSEESILEDRVNRDVRTGPQLGAVIVPAIIAVPERHVVRPQEVEGLGGVGVDAIVLAGGAFVVTETLAGELTA